MNFESLKMDFLNYLKSKKIEEGKENSSFEINGIDSLYNSSIFANFDEFKNYLIEEVNADASIFSKGYDEIMSMDFENGKFVENKENNSDSFEKDDNPNFFTEILNGALSDKDVINTFDQDKSGNLNIDEVSTFLGNFTKKDAENNEINLEDVSETVFDIQTLNSIKEKDISDKDMINKLLEEIYENEIVIENLDLDGDKKLSNEEKSKFEKFIMNYDGQKDNLSIEDIQNAFTNILQGNFSYNEDDTNISKETDKLENIDEQEEKINTQESKNTPNVNNTSNTTGYYNGGGSVGQSSSSNATQPKTIKTMTLEELKSEKTKKESEVTKAQDAVNGVYSGENKAVKDAEDDCKEKQESYEKAVSEDKNISQEIKDKLKTNLSDIESQENVIDKLKIDINNKNAEITNQETIISSDKSNISALKSCISSLSAAEPENEEQKAEINAKKNEAETKLSEANEKLKTDKEKLEDLKNDKNSLEEKLNVEETTLNELKITKSEIEKEIEKTASPETKEAMKAYNEAKENVETVKTRELKSAEKTLSTAQSELDEINEQIDIKEAENLSSEYSVNKSDLPADIAAKLDAKLGSGFSNRLSEIAKKYGCSEQDLIGLMYSESGLDPQACNSSSGATGLIQFMPSTASSLGTSTNALKNMTGVEQLEYVDKYLDQYLNEGGNYSAGDLYTTVFLPAFLGDDVLTRSGEIYYQYNSGLDLDGNGDISKTDLTKRVKNKYQEFLEHY